MSAFLDIVFSSESAPVIPSFLGYAFQGTDLVIGPEGYADFIASGQEFMADCDGCYLHIQPDKVGNNVFSTDFHGYFPLFYYHSGVHWILSPSFELVAKEVHRRGLPLTLRNHQLLSWSSPAAILQMPTSARSPFDEIYLLSYDQEIVAGRHGLILRRKKRTLDSASYGEALAGMMATWGGRILTILDGGMAIRADLSGGVDSRAVMALLHWTLQKIGRLDLLHSESILINSHPGMIEDYEIARALGKEFNFPLNNAQRRKYVMATAEESFSTWKQYNLARYSPHILPLTTLDSNIITFNGVGGEEHRAFYDKFGRGPFGEYVASYLHIFKSLKTLGTWMGDLHSDIDLPVSSYDRKIPAAMRHYRRHRGRHHTAKQPVSEFMGVILASRASYECASFLDTSTLESNQLLFDIMINCNQRLACMPYDHADKAPGKVNFDNLTRIDDVRPDPAGRIWRRLPLPHDDPVSSKERNIPLRAAVEAALGRPEVREMAGEAIVLKVQAQLAQLTPSNNLHQNGYLLHYILLVDVVSRYQTPA